MTHYFKPGHLAIYTGSLVDSGRRTGDVLRAVRRVHTDYWEFLVLRTGATMRTNLPYFKPIGDQDDGNP